MSQADTCLNGTYNHKVMHTISSYGRIHKTFFVVAFNWANKLECLSLSQGSFKPCLMSASKA